MSIIKTWSNIRTSLTQAQINSQSIPRLDPSTPRLLWSLKYARFLTNVWSYKGRHHVTCQSVGELQIISGSKCKIPEHCVPPYQSQQNWLSRDKEKNCVKKQNSMFFYEMLKGNPHSTLNLRIKVLALTLTLMILDHFQIVSPVWTMSD